MGDLAIHYAPAIGTGDALPLCGRIRGVNSSRLTNDADEVTCKRCLKLQESLPPLGAPQSSITKEGT